jgi:hypothetical protein
MAQLHFLESDRGSLRRTPRPLAFWDDRAQIPHDACRADRIQPHAIRHPSWLARELRGALTTFRALFRCLASTICSPIIAQDLAEEEPWLYERGGMGDFGLCAFDRASLAITRSRTDNHAFALSACYQDLVIPPLLVRGIVRWPQRRTMAAKSP